MVFWFETVIAAIVALYPLIIVCYWSRSKFLVGLLERLEASRKHSSILRYRTLKLCKFDGVEDLISLIVEVHCLPLIINHQLE